MTRNLSSDSKAICEILSADQLITAINNQIRKRNNDNITVDISFLNIMDACKVSMLCSTEHYIKYPAGKISWIVNNKDVENFTKSMAVGNSEFYLAK